MDTTLSDRSIGAAAERLRSMAAEHAAAFPGEPAGRQPVHVVYGGAQLFRSDTAVKLAGLATRAFQEYAPDAEALSEVFGIGPAIAPAVHERVADKLAREAVEDLRIDFEDGYGTRSDEEEDGHAAAAASEMAKGMADGTLPPFTGIRIKSLSAEAHRRALRTLDIFLSTLVSASGGGMPDGFVITLPKVVSTGQVAVLADVLDELESSLGIAPGTVGIEIMIETAQAVIAGDGTAAARSLAAAARGRCRAAHFGAYDYTASLGITSAHQDMLHPACDLARHIMQVSLAGTGVRISDGATNVMPVGPHRGDALTAEQRAENRSVVHRAWKLHYGHCRRSLANGFYQGWDLHPAQLPSRYAAIYAFFLEDLENTAVRLRNFVEKAARATMVGDQFDDAATGQGLLLYFLRAVGCGAVTEAEAAGHTRLTLDELRRGSFAEILRSRAV